MSLGIGAFCKLTAQDENTVIYEYGSYNQNESKYRNENRISDGIITISKSSLVEPDIHHKIKRLPNGKKKQIVKQIANDIPLEDLFTNKSVIVVNCSNCWQTNKDDIDVMALTIVFYIFTEYQKNGYLPETISINK